MEVRLPTPIDISQTEPTCAPSIGGARVDQAVPLTHRGLAGQRTLKPALIELFDQPVR